MESELSTEQCKRKATQHATRNGFVPVKDPIVFLMLWRVEEARQARGRKCSQHVQTRMGHKHSTVYYYCLKSRLKTAVPPATDSPYIPPKPGNISISAARG
jgi:hypothetical protein